MASVGLLDWDLIRWQQPTVFNLELMKLSTHLKGQRMITKMLDRYDDSRYSKIIVRKDYEDDDYPSDIFNNPKTESGGPLGFNKSRFVTEYEVVNTIGYVGKYQFGYQALKDLGYLTSDCASNAQMNNPNKWKGKNGIDSLNTFLKTSAGHAEQETAICEYTKRNYTSMVQRGAITKEMKPEEVAGMLAVSHLLGAGGANSWRKGQGGEDAYGTTGDKYFQNGKYAVAVLAPKLATIDQPRTA
jgi:hypothetical protein